jgi:hypothetical protein
VKKTLIASCSALALFGIGSAVAGDTGNYEPFSGGYVGLMLGAQSTDFDNGYVMRIPEDGECGDITNEGDVPNSVEIAKAGVAG